MNKQEEKLFRKAFDFFEDKKNLEKSKKAFEKEAKKFFEDNAGVISVESDESISRKIKINKCQRKKIVFDISKLSKKLPKKMVKQIAKTTVEVEDYLGLSNYLKNVGADPEIVKSFLRVSKVVDEKQIEQLSNLGKLSSQDIDGCYSIVLGNPYYTVNVK